MVQNLDVDKRWIELRRSLHQIPEPGFHEFKTQQVILGFLATLPQARLRVTTWKTGVLVRIIGSAGEGAGTGQTLGLRVDMDGLPIKENTSYEFKSTHDGMMHACGHDIHMTIGCAVAHYFAHHSLSADVLIIFQPAEEGPGGALPMLQSTEFQAWKPDHIIALHIAPEYPIGTIATHPGILFANTSELFIDLKGLGGHAAFPHRANDMVIAAAHLVTQLQTVVARNIDPLDSAVLTIGKITGGTKQNIIAETARLEGTIRALSADVMSLLKHRVATVVAGIEAGFECTAQIDYGANYRQVDNDVEMCGAFMEWVVDTQVAKLVRCKEAMTGEDFGYFLADIPGFMFWLGVDTPYGLHHAKLEPNEAAIATAISVITRYFEWKSQH